MGSAALEERLRRFTGLTAAQRALSRSIHPAEIAPLHEQSRALLIELRDLAGRKKEGAAPESVLEHIDRALVEQSEQTRTFIDRIDMRQLRATIPMIAHQHPDEVCGVVDLLLGGDLGSDKNLRTLEYLITLLCAEEVSGRRRIRRSPSELTELLRATCEAQKTAADSDWLVNERMLEQATDKVMQGGDVGEIRDRIRRCKEDLGVQMLHPGVLMAAMKYNVAMWNQVAAEIDSSRSIEELASDLLAADEGELPMPLPGSTGSSLLDSQDFAGLLQTFTARVRGEEPEPSRFDRIVDRLPIDRLPPARVEDFDDPDPDTVTWHVRAAVMMGLVLEGLPTTGDALTVSGLDPVEFTTTAYDELVARMTELGRKHFASSDDAQAFRLSDVKTHHLTIHRAARDRAAGGDEEETGRRGARRSGDADGTGWSAWLGPLAQLLPSGTALVGLLALIPLLLVFFAPSITSDNDLDAAKLQTISPFLTSGHIQGDAGAGHYVARVAGTWAYLGDAERRKVGMEIGAGFEQLGAMQVTLVDPLGLIVMRYENGRITMLTPHIDASGS